jgi:hypothetical protein
LEHPVPHDNATAEKSVRPKLSAKDEVRALLDRLPDDVSLEDIQYHLDVVAMRKIAIAGLASRASSSEAAQ